MKKILSILSVAAMATLVNFALPACDGGDSDEGEGEGEGGAIDDKTTVEAYCAKMKECDALEDQTEAQCATEQQGAISDAQGVNDTAGLCDDIADAAENLLACVSTKTCAQLASDTDPCQSQNDAYIMLVYQGAGPCFQGQQPIDPPDGWNCMAGFYGTNDGCDCGCGIADPDCGNGGCTEAGCDDGDVCQYCFDGTTTNECTGEGEGEGEGE